MCQYDYVGQFIDGITSVCNNSKWGFIDKAGREVIPLKYDAVMFSDGMIAVRIDDKWGFVDRNGNELIPIVYDSVGSFSDGFAMVSGGGSLITTEWGTYYNGSKWGLIDKSGREVIPL